MSKNIKFAAIRYVISGSKCTKPRFRLRLRPGSRLGAHDAPQTRLLAGEQDTNSPYLPLDVFGVSISALTAPRFLGPIKSKIPGYAAYAYMYTDAN